MVQVQLLPSAMVPLTLLVLDMVKSGHCTITMAVAVPLSKVTLGLPLLQVLSLVNVAVAWPLAWIVGCAPERIPCGPAFQVKGSPISTATWAAVRKSTRL